MTDKEFLEALGFVLSEMEFPIGISGLLTSETIYIASDTLSPRRSVHVKYVRTPMTVSKELEERNAWMAIKHRIVVELFAK